MQPDPIQDELIRLAEITAAIIDGEDVKGIVTADAMHHIRHPDAKHRFLSMDHYDVEHGPFLRVKKLLMRIERLGAVPVNAAVWLPVPETDQVTCVLLNGPCHRYYTFGQQQMPAPDEMRRVFETGEIAAAPGDAKWATALAPVRDSLYDVVAVVELTSPLDPEAPAFV
jgi:hypothetical protein